MFWWTKWMLTVKLIYKLSNVPDDMKWAKNTHMTPFTLTFKEGITNDIYGFGRLFSAFYSVHHPSTHIIRPVHIRFYPTKWRVDGSLHKAMQGWTQHCLPDSQSDKMQSLQGCLCRTSQTHFLAKKFVINKMRSNYTKCINPLVPS